MRGQVEAVQFPVGSASHKPQQQAGHESVPSRCDSARAGWRPQRGCSLIRRPSPPSIHTETPSGASEITYRLPGQAISRPLATDDRAALLNEVSERCLDGPKTRVVHSQTTGVRPACECSPGVDNLAWQWSPAACSALRVCEASQVVKTCPLGRVQVFTGQGAKATVEHSGSLHYACTLHKRCLLLVL